MTIEEMRQKITLLKSQRYDYTKQILEIEKIQQNIDHELNVLNQNLMQMLAQARSERMAYIPSDHKRVQ